MSCSSCVHLIERTLQSTAGVEKAVVTLTTNRGYVEFDHSILGARDIIKIIKVVLLLLLLLSLLHIFFRI